MIMIIHSYWTPNKHTISFKPENYQLRRFHWESCFQKLHKNKYFLTKISLESLKSFSYKQDWALSATEALPDCGFSWIACKNLLEVLILTYHSILIKWLDFYEVNEIFIIKTRNQSENFSQNFVTIAGKNCSIMAAWCPLRMALTVLNFNRIILGIGTCPSSLWCPEPREVHKSCDC